MDKVGAGHYLLQAGWRVPLIRQAIAARQGATPPPSAREARDFQRRILAEISAAPWGPLPTVAPTRRADGRPWHGARQCQRGLGAAASGHRPQNRSGR
jgi:hypothetical protein